MKWAHRLASSLSLLSLFYSAAHADHTVEDARLSKSSITAHWNLTEKPNLNDTTSNFIFETANSLLQHWPNTRYRNGHTLIPASIPPGTLLYHGTAKKDIPTVPEWVAMDPEHSYLLCGVMLFPRDNSSNGETNSRPLEGDCWHLTFVTTRPLKLLYFDGSAAARIPDGPVDSQDLLTWGEIREDLLGEERERIDRLCEWGKQYNLDGFIRMEMDIEVMLCDFTKGLNPVTTLQLPRAVKEPGKPSLALVPLRIRLLEASGWSNRFPGDHRIKVDYSRLISFYDKRLFPNLHLQRVGQERWDHRIKGISSAELDTLDLRLKEVFTEQARGSVIDWKTLLHVVMNRYADRLELLQTLLENSTHSYGSDQEVAFWKAHRFVTNVLTPYILHDSVPPENWTRNDHDWAAPVFKYCASTHTQYLETSLLTSLTASEKLLLNAIREVSKEICRVLVSIWAEGKEFSTKKLQGPDEPNLAAQHPSRINDGVNETRLNILMRWKSSVSDLMAWLDWSVWVRCRPECSYNEMCYLPTWPYFKFHRGIGDKYWKRPQPSCIPRLEPYEL